VKETLALRTKAVELEVFGWRALFVRVGRREWWFQRGT
jgi:hypothetical protein